MAKFSVQLSAALATLAFAGVIQPARAQLSDTPAQATPDQPKSTMLPDKPGPGVTPSEPPQSLSKQLDQSQGVITPPNEIDPGMTKPAPDVGPRSTPVIPPPGTQGNNPNVQPK
jgi:hypothetical protein